MLFKIYVLFHVHFQHTDWAMLPFPPMCRESNSFETGIRCAQEAQRLQFSQIQAILDSKKFEYSGVILHITLPEVHNS